MGFALSRLLLGSAMLCAVLVVFAGLRKHRRDRHEAEFAARRARLRALALVGDIDALTREFRALRRDPDAQIDLAVALADVASWQDLEAVHALHEAAAEAGLDRLLMRKLRSRDPVHRGQAGLLVSRLRLPEAPRHVARLVRDRDGDVRLVAVAALAEIGDDAAARVLIETLGARVLAPERVIERLGARWAVPTILEVLRSGGAGPDLVGAEESDRMAWRPIQAHLARALGLAGEPRAAPVLCELLRTGGCEERASAARALATTGTRAVAPDLVHALEDPEWQVRAQAAKALGALRAHESTGSLERCLGDRSWWVRANAAEALAWLGEPGIAALRRVVQHGDRYARDRAREALALHDLALGVHE